MPQLDATPSGTPAVRVDLAPGGARFRLLDPPEGLQRLVRIVGQTSYFEYVGPSLADELRAGPIDDARALDLAVHVTRILADLKRAELAHGNLSAETIVFPIHLGGEPMLALPAVPPDGRSASHGPDTRALPAILTAALGRPLRAEVAEALAMGPDPGRRLAYLRACPGAGEVPDSGARSHPQDRAFVEALRDDPRDDATRSVYADWLEQHGDPIRARFLRLDTGAPDVDIVALGEVAPRRDAWWRALLSRAAIRECGVDGCPRRWDRLEPTPEEQIRRCTTCDQDIQYEGRRDPLEYGFLNTYAFDAWCDADRHEHVEEQRRAKISYARVEKRAWEPVPRYGVRPYDRMKVIG